MSRVLQLRISTDLFIELKCNLTLPISFLCRVANFDKRYENIVNFNDNSLELIKRSFILREPLFFVLRSFFWWQFFVFSLICLLLENPDHSSQEVGFAPNLRGQYALITSSFSLFTCQMYHNLSNTGSFGLFAILRKFCIVSCQYWLHSYIGSKEPGKTMLTPYFLGGDGLPAPSGSATG